MVAIVSPEFVSLCQTQLRSLTNQVAESSAAVYIADIAEPTAETAWERQRNEPDFVPVVSCPESLSSWMANFSQWSSNRTATSSELLALPAGQADEEQPSTETVSAHPTAASDDWPERMQPEQQLVVPLVYAEVVVGLLVAIRRDRAWQHEEQHHIEDMAQSLAAGCVLERRNQWLRSQIEDKRDLQSRQSEIFHNLLHQFRNPLTAVTTFGQLLVRRLEPEDPNQKIATGIVRESKRLREMVSHFDETVAIGDADLATDVTGPPLLPPSPLSLPQGTEPPTSSQNTGNNPTAHTALEYETLASETLAEPLANEHSDNSAYDQHRPLGGLGHSLILSAQYLPDIVEPILAIASIVAMEKGVTLQAQVAPDTPSVWGEEEALCEVISNLVDNAVKYSPAGAQVWVQTGVSRLSAASQHANAAYSDTQYQGVVIGDTGPGIPPEDLTHLFERNYRGIQASGDIPGTGLGLAIAQALMSEMQGYIEVISPAAGTAWMPSRIFDEAEVTGAGTVFIVWLAEVERLGGDRS
ncbi:MAG: ATP-binding protein [Cyanobacteria bacterium J06632_3]